MTNRSAGEDPVEMTTDGRPACPVSSGQTIRIRFEEGRSLLAQTEGATFYHRMRDKFGRLAY